MGDYCKEVIDLLEDVLLKNTTNPEAQVFYLKMKGDYFRYLGEYKSGADRKKVIDDA